MRLAFAGTPEVALPSLERLAASPHTLAAVVTRPDAPAGRGRGSLRSPVGRWADEHGVPVLTPRRAGDPEFLAALAELAPDCCPVVAYGALLPTAALGIPRYGWVNLHFSLLPAWRGAAPVQHAVLAGDEVSGATTFRIVEELDAGPVYGVLTESVRPRDTSGDLLGRLAQAGAELLLATLDGIETGTLCPQPQDAAGVSLAPKITTQDARVDWAASAFVVDRRIRACTPAPGAWCSWRGDRVKLGPVRPLPTEGTTDVTLGPGELLVERGRVLAGTGTVPVVLGEVQAPGKRAMPAADWARGTRPEAGEVLA